MDTFLERQKVMKLTQEDCIEKHKTLLKEIKDNKNKRENIPCS